MLLAVLKAKEKISIGSCDVFVSVVGGIQVLESGSDLPVVMSLVSAMKKESLLSTTCFVGEVGLTGELQTCPADGEPVEDSFFVGVPSVLYSICRRIND